MTQTMSPQITYRRTKAGEWVAFGPAAALAGRQSVTVTKRDGTTEWRVIVRLGRSFVTGGTEMVYAYLTERPAQAAPSRRNNWEPRSCQDCQDVEDASDARGCPRHRGNPRN